jgi:hypothetical protein
MGVGAVPFALRAPHEPPIDVEQRPGALVLGAADPFSSRSMPRDFARLASALPRTYRQAVRQ